MAIFIGFGFWGLYEYVPEEFLTAPAVLAVTAAVLAAVFALGREDMRRLAVQRQAAEPE